jgi:hypothetical protein
MPDEAKRTVIGILIGLVVLLAVLLALQAIAATDLFHSTMQH